MKVLAKDLKHGQRFRAGGGVAIASGLVDASGLVVSLVSGRVCYVPDWHQVELIDPPAEPTYAELQAEWCNNYGIKVGSKVKVTRRAEDGEQDWRAVWVTKMNRYVGSVGTIDEIHQKDGLAIDEWYFPYFVLEPVKDPTYRPYTDAELLEQLGAKVRLKSKDRSHGRLIAGVDLGTAVIGLERVSAEALRNKYEHLDGTPCGVEE